jgi:hypothetical protein
VSPSNTSTRWHEPGKNDQVGRHAGRAITR